MLMSRRIAAALPGRHMSGGRCEPLHARRVVRGDSRQLPVAPKALQDKNPVVGGMCPVHSLSAGGDRGNPPPVVPVHGVFGAVDAVTGSVRA